MQKWWYTQRNSTLPWHLLEEKEEHGCWGWRKAQELRWVWTWPVEHRGRALMSQMLSPAGVSASCNVIVLWHRHQQAQLSCPSPCCSLSRERKFSLFCAVRLCFWADDCILKRHCVRLEKASLSERFQGGGFGTTAHKTETWLCYLPTCHQIYTVHLLPSQQKGWKRRKADHTFLQAMGSHFFCFLKIFFCQNKAGNAVCVCLCFGEDRCHKAVVSSNF